MMGYADQLIMEGRNNVNHSAGYTHRCRCWGKCFDEYKKQSKGMSAKKFKRLFGAKELSEVRTDWFESNEEHKVVKVFYGPWREFLVTETGMWTTIKCPKCGYSELWAAGDGDERF